MKFLIVLSCIALCRAQLKSIEAQPEPFSPYSFSYEADAPDGGSARQESADASGVVRGSYSLYVSADGLKRIVTYIADENGFRAQVQTNEPGTESQSPADTIVQSSQLPAEEIALRVGPRPDEQKPETLTVKGLQKKLVSPILLNSGAKSILLNRPLFDQTLFQQKFLTEIPLQKKLDSTLTLPEVRQTFPSIPSIQLRRIETPIKLLSKIPKIQTFKPIELDSQQKEEFVAQNFERF